MIHHELLTEETISREAKILEAIGRCESGWVLYGRDWDEGDIRTRETLAVTWACGLRACPRCEGRAWAGAKRAMLLPDVDGYAPQWRTFITMTFARHRGPMELWHGIAGYMGQLVAAIRQRAMEMSPFRGPRGGLVRGVPMQYAWVIEPHKEGSWPHVHMVVSEEMCGSKDKSSKWWRFIRIQWARITKRGLQRVEAKPVWSLDGAAYYLTKYLSKSKWSTTLLAVMYRRRRWSTSRRGPVEEKSGWSKVGNMGWKAVKEWRDKVEALSGARVTLDLPGRYKVEVPSIHVETMYPIDDRPISWVCRQGELGVCPPLASPAIPAYRPWRDPFRSPYRDAGIVPAAIGST